MKWFVELFIAIVTLVEHVEQTQYRRRYKFDFFFLLVN